MFVIRYKEDLLWNSDTNDTYEASWDSNDLIRLKVLNTNR